MATEQIPAIAVDSPAKLTTEEPSPKSVIPPNPAVTSPTSPAENQPVHPTKTEEAVGTHKPPLESEATSVSSSSLLGSYGDVGSKNRDEALAKVSLEKTLSHIRAWEENAKSKSLNKYNRVVAKITAWENTKKATAEAKLRKAEEKLEKKRAAYVEKMKNKIAEVHREAEEKRALAEATRGEEHVKAEEMSAKYKATGQVPKKFLCFGA